MVNFRLSVLFNVSSPKWIVRVITRTENARASSSRRITFSSIDSAIPFKRRNRNAVNHFLYLYVGFRLLDQLKTELIRRAKKCN